MLHSSISKLLFVLYVLWVRFYYWRVSGLAAEVVCNEVLMLKFCFMFLDLVVQKFLEWHCCWRLLCEALLDHTTNYFCLFMVLTVLLYCFCIFVDFVVLKSFCIGSSCHVSLVKFVLNLFFCKLWMFCKFSSRSGVFLSNFAALYSVLEISVGFFRLTASFNVVSYVVCNTRLVLLLCLLYIFIASRCCTHVVQIPWRLLEDLVDTNLLMMKDYVISLAQCLYCEWLWLDATSTSA